MRQRIRLAILECDTPLPETKAQYGGYGGVFKSLLAGGAKLQGIPDLEEIFDISVYNVVDDPECYPDIDKVDALLLTGSKHNSFDDSPWILKLVDYIAKALSTEGIRIVGVCYGHQIIARAMGAKVGRNSLGWEAAVHDVQLSPRGKELFGFDVLRIHQMHRDMVYEYPEGVEQLGSSPVCQVQGMYIPGRMISVQGHPEFTSEIITEIIETRHKTGIFDEEAYKTHVKKINLPHNGVVVGGAFVKFMLEG